MIFIDNKYTKWYYAIVQNANPQVLDKETYIEKHHIIPRSLGGDNSKENLVKHLKDQLRVGCLLI